VCATATWVWSHLASGGGSARPVAPSSPPATAPDRDALPLIPGPLAHALVALNVPNDPRLVGLSVFAQWLVPDAANSPIGSRPAMAPSW
jgi:hypothetical protein